jgi:predicted AAA+ superfamily ATPase
MVSRLAEARISDLLTRFPAVAVLGPRQVGKTTLALRLAEESDTNERQGVRPLFVADFRPWHHEAGVGA